MGVKVILTEEQFNKLMAYEAASQFLYESLNIPMSFSALKRKVKMAIIGGIALTTIFSAIHKLHIDNIQKQKLIELATLEAERHKQDSIFNVQVEACKKYMEFALGNNGKTLNDTKLKPETLVRAANELNFDLPFLLAVAHQESCFGIGPRALRTNSVFSVGSYDDGSNHATYSDPNESVVPYINLLKKHYLVNGKTLKDLLVPGQFVNDNGDRYASDKNYEKKINYLRNLVIKQCPELAKK
jgi:hypothetical protein